jgi:uncharacterized surface protein with fasciclin (FAS1) repeats
MSKNIVETACEAGSFTTPLAAVGAAGLGETLADGGPFTVSAHGDVVAGDAHVASTDIEASNGVIDVIDRVLLPAAA